MTTPTAENAIYEYTKQVALEAYIYGYAPVTQFNLMARDLAYRAPMNEMFYMSGASTPSDQIFSGPNADTVYATAWLDLTNTPVFIDTPDTKNQTLWFTIQLLDAYTNTITNIPGISKQRKPQKFIVIGPNVTTNDVKVNPNIARDVRIVYSPTNLVYLVSRTSIPNHDIDTAVSISQQIKIKPMYRNSVVLEIEPFSTDIFTTNLFYSALLKLMKYNPPPSENAPLTNLFKTIGLDPDVEFNAESLPENVQQALTDAAIIGYQQVIPFGYLYGTSIVSSNFWLGGTDMGIWKNDYLRRDFVAYGGSAGNVSIEQNYLTCVQDSTGALVNGANHNYKMHFNSDLSNYPETTNGFWSITLYVNSTLVPGFNLQLYDNAINRYSLATNNNDLVYNGDYSMDIFIQHDAPTDPNEYSNWLPCPAGPFRLIFRVYSATVDQVYTPNIPALVVNDPI